MGRGSAPFASGSRSVRRRVRDLLEPSPGGRWAIRVYQRTKHGLEVLRRWVEEAFASGPGGIAMSDELLDLLNHRRDITVIVPIHGAPDEVERCLHALRRNTTWCGLRLLLIDDASEDRRIDALMDRAASWPNVDVLRNDENLGYVRTVNRGLRRSSGDVILLNSDTEVTPRWIQGLAFAAHRDAVIGTVTAVSGNAGAFSVPQVGGGEIAPDHLSPDEVGRLVASGSRRTYPETPTANGFCMFIKREVLDSVGPLDAERFPRAYGEENDLSMRASRAGWHHVVDDATFVHHRGSASFGAVSGAEMNEQAQRTLDELYPEYRSLAHEFVGSTRMRKVRERVGDLYASAEEEQTRYPPRVLHVLHGGEGGAPWTVHDLAGAVSDEFESLVLTSDRERLRVFPAADPDAILAEVPLEPPLTVRDVARPDYRSEVGRLLLEFGIEIVHIHHLAGHTLELPSVARTLDVPVILTLHDYYLVCPTIHLIDHRGDFCYGTCTPGQGECPVPRQWRDGVPHLKHTWVHVWQQHVADMMEHVDAVVGMSESSSAIFEEAFPQLRDNIRIIEHGRDLRSGPEPDDRGPSLHVNILVPGNIGPHKGGDLIRTLRDIDDAGESRLRFHFLGKIAEQYRGLGTWHGTYARDDAVRRIRDVAPRFVGVFSVWAETYSYVLSEAWAAGIPVLVTDLGAQAERVRRHGGGWVLGHRDPEAMYEQILELHEDEEAYRLATSQARSMRGVRSMTSMAGDWQSLYREVMDAHRMFVEPTSRAEG